MSKLKQLNKTVAFIGAGNMAEALFAGFIASTLVPARRIIATDIRRERVQELKKQYGIIAGADNATAVQQADILFLAVKPQQIEAVLREIGPTVSARQVIVSIAAGVTTKFIQSFLKVRVPVIRLMPNTPALVRCGAIAMARGRHATPAHALMVRRLLETVGIVVDVQEKNINAVTALSGSGPAYVFYLCEAMQKAGVALGLSRAVAGLLARQTVFGSGVMLKTSSDDAAELRRKVTSPGGTTHAAISHFEDKQWCRTVTEALKCAQKRAQELSR
ncbi:MAG: pyrroline-5-carboxylate reductase [Elusimicrobia bacterium]|nr:pyrroline-5-carboxylate reductase [Elusimicrobiota bacterium]